MNNQTAVPNKPKSAAELNRMIAERLGRPVKQLPIAPRATRYAPVTFRRIAC